MGVINVTPDSFSDGGDHYRHDDAIRRGLEMLEQGADLLDVGGESTRPGAEPVSPAEERDRVLPVVERLAADGAVVSIDSSKASVAEAALDAGAAVVNDVSALGDPDMGPLVADRGVGLVLMHMQGEPRTMQQNPFYDDVVEDVATDLASAADRAIELGVDGEAICLDPGIGFGKALSHNLDLIAMGVSRLRQLGYPVLVGASRKSFIIRVLGQLEPVDRDPASAVAHALAIAGGASVIRAHNVVMALRTARMADAIVRGPDDRP